MSEKLPRKLDGSSPHTPPGNPFHRGRNRVLDDNLRDIFLRRSDRDKQNRNSRIQELHLLDIRLQDQGLLKNSKIN